MRPPRKSPQPDRRIIERINHRGCGVTVWRRLHDHGSRGAKWGHINPLRIDVICRRWRIVCHGPADSGSGGKSANDACRHWPASGTGTGNPRHRQGENDRRNRRDFHKPFHIDPSRKKFLSFADPMLPHPALFNPRPSNSRTIGFGQSCTRFRQRRDFERHLSGGNCEFGDFSSIRGASSSRKRRRTQILKPARERAGQ